MLGRLQRKIVGSAVLHKHLTLIDVCVCVWETGGDPRVKCHCPEEAEHSIAGAKCSVYPQQPGREGQP